MSTLNEPPFPACAEPPRMGRLPVDVGVAARLVSPVLWGQEYREGEGPLHHAGGPYWRKTLLHNAHRWELLADAARRLSEVMPHD